MQINRDNYEVFFIDFLDGKLSPSDEKLLLAFLNQNPDLASELEAVESMVLIPEQNSFTKKELLKKEESYYGINNRFDYLCIASIEDDITTQEKKELNGLLKNDSKKKREFFQFNKLKLIADPNIKYNGKSSLKRLGILSISPRTFISVSSVAAVVLVSFGIFSILWVNPVVEENHMATAVVVDNTPKPIVQEENSSLTKPIVAEKRTNDITVIPEISTKIADAEQPLVVDTSIPEKETLVRLEPMRISGISQPQPIAENNILAYFEKPAQLNIVDNTQSPSSRSSGVREIGLFEIAQMGINRLSAFAGSSINLDAEKNVDGKIKKIKFESTLFALSVPVNKK
jgi:hypothetical protein